MNKRTPSRRKSLADRIREAGGTMPNPHAAYLANRRWMLVLDPDLVELLSAEGNVSDRLFGLAALRSRVKRERMVVTVPLTEAEFRELRPLIDRLGAEVRYVPPHPNTKRQPIADRPRRKAG